MRNAGWWSDVGSRSADACRWRRSEDRLRVCRAFWAWPASVRTRLRRWRKMAMYAAGVRRREMKM